MNLCKVSATVTYMYTSFIATSLLCTMYVIQTSMDNGHFNTRNDIHKFVWLQCDVTLIFSAEI